MSWQNHAFQWTLNFLYPIAWHRIVSQGRGTSCTVWGGVCVCVCVRVCVIFTVVMSLTAVTSTPNNTTGWYDKSLCILTQTWRQWSRDYVGNNVQGEGRAVGKEGDSSRMFPIYVSIRITRYLIITRQYFQCSIKYTHWCIKIYVH